MKRIKAQIWYDAKGQIIAVGYAPQRAGKGAQAKQVRQTVPLAYQRQFILEVELPEKMIRRVHQTYRIDVKSRTLIEERGAETEI